MIDNEIRLVLDRLELEDREERARGLPSSERSRAVARTTGIFLLGLVSARRQPRLLARAPVRPDARVRNDSVRSGPGAHHRPGRFRMIRLPRKGGGPDVTDSSTGSGGTSG